MKKIFKAICILFLLALMGGCAGPLQSAAENGDIQIINKLLNDGVNINEQAQYGPVIIHASRYCQLETVKLLLEKGADINGTGPMKLTALHTAAAGGCNDLIRYLIEKGAAIDTISATGYTPLSVAAFWNKYESVKLLIEKGADPDIAINGLIRNKNNAAAQIVEQVAKSVQKGKIQKPPRYGDAPSQTLPTALPLPTEPAAPF